MKTARSIDSAAQIRETILRKVVELPGHWSPRRLVRESGHSANKVRTAIRVLRQNGELEDNRLGTAETGLVATLDGISAVKDIVGRDGAPISAFKTDEDRVRAATAELRRGDATVHGVWKKTRLNLDEAGRVLKMMEAEGSVHMIPGGAYSLTNKVIHPPVQGPRLPAPPEPKPQLVAPAMRVPAKVVTPPKQEPPPTGPPPLEAAARAARRTANRVSSGRVDQVVDLISKRPKGASVTSLAREMGVTQTSASRIVRRAAEKGLVHSTGRTSRTRYFLGPGPAQKPKPATVTPDPVVTVTSGPSVSDPVLTEAASRVLGKATPDLKQAAADRFNREAPPGSVVRYWDRVRGEMRGARVLQKAVAADGRASVLLEISGQRVVTDLHNVDWGDTVPRDPPPLPPPLPDIQVTWDPPVPRARDDASPPDDRLGKVVRSTLDRLKVPSHMSLEWRLGWLVGKGTGW